MGLDRVRLCSSSSSSRDSRHLREEDKGESGLCLFRRCYRIIIPWRKVTWNQCRLRNLNNSTIQGEWTETSAVVSRNINPTGIPPPPKENPPLISLPLEFPQSPSKHIQFAFYVLMLISLIARNVRTIKEFQSKMQVLHLTPISINIPREYVEPTTLNQ